MATARVQPDIARPARSVERWDYETDVAVIGMGGAGACAAIEACDAGADVLVFELASAPGGSTALSSAELYLGGSGGTRVQKACGYEDSSDAMYAYLCMSMGPQADTDKIRAYVDGASAHFDWLVAQGVPFRDSEYKARAMMALTDDCLLYTGSEKAWPYRDQAKPCPRGHNLEIKGDNGGPLLMKILAEALGRRNVQVHCEARALQLITEGEGAELEVTGVVVRIDQQQRFVRARAGVVLCAGGFVMNSEMVQKYAPELARCTIPIGNPGDTGSGIQMGLSVGAAAINMHEGFVSLPFYPPASLTYGIFVNAQGQRFINEDVYHGRAGAAVLRQPNMNAYLILSVEDYGDYETNSYLGAPVAATGESVEELEGELNLPAGQLVNTCAFFNEHAAQGQDPLYRKSAEWLKPLKAPLVALDISPGHGAYFPYFTLGGLDTTPSGEVRRSSGSIITGLYAAGRTACGVPRRGDGYASGMSVGDATFSGRMAGRAAAARSKHV